MDTGSDTHGGEHEPNEEGFAGEPTTPEPSGTDESWGADIAIPAGDITGALTEAIEGATGRDDEPLPEPGWRSRATSGALDVGPAARR